MKAYEILSFLPYYPTPWHAGKTMYFCSSSTLLKKESRPGGEMTQTLYAHINKRKKYKIRYGKIKKKIKACKGEVPRVRGLQRDLLENRGPRYEATQL
jgi:hypothetical protein